MRVTQTEMESGHRRIVEGASRLLRKQGVRDTSVASAMQEAGMTHGGFYRHFETKDDLVIEALREAFDEFVLPLELRQELATPKAVAAEYKALYLSEQHLDNPGQGCPMPALGSDIARAADSIKSEFGAGAQRLIAAMARTKQGSPEERNAAATREIAMLVGAMLIARASNAQTARAVLDACKD